MPLPDSQLSVLAVSLTAEIGGAETLVLDILRGLRARGNRVMLVTLGEGPLIALARSAGLHVLPGPTLSFRRPLSVMRAAGHVRHAVLTFRPNVLHASHPRAGLLGRLAFVGGDIRRTTQLLEPYEPTDMIGWTCLRLGGTYFALTPATTGSPRKLSSRFDPVVVSPGVDAAELAARAEIGDGDRCWLELTQTKPGHPRIVMVGRFQPSKGVFDFVRMASLVIANRPDARFMMIGPDSSRSPEVRSSLRAEIQAGGLDGKVALAGPLSAPDLAATLDKATLLVHPAHREGFGLVVVEALALGTPVVAYAASGPAYVLSQGGGSLVPVGDIDALAQRVLKLIDKPSSLHDLQQETLIAARRFKLEATVDRYSSAFADAAGPIT